MRHVARVMLEGAAAFLAVAMSSCAGQGIGTASGTITVPICELDGAYDLQPNFFGANLYGRAVIMRIQNGGGTPDYNDTLTVAIDDTEAVQRMIAQCIGGMPVAGCNATDGSVTVPVGPRGAPGVLVHATLTPDHSCGRVKVSRFGEVVGLTADSDPSRGFASTMTIRSVVNPGGTVTEQQDDKLTDVPAFTFWLHDDRAVGANAPAGISPDSQIGSATLTGSFRFEYSTELPAQDFP